VPFLLAERAHSESARSMRAVKGNLDHSLEQMFRAEEEMEPEDLLCSRNARPPTALARANGTSRRASGWAGEKAARSGRSISPHP
jgi:hypothetical protein